MSVVEPGSSANLIGRVAGILMRPGATWDEIDREPATIGGLYTRYIMILAAIPVIAGAIGMTVFGIGAFGITVRISPVWALTNAVVSYALSLAMVYVLALIIEALAPSFGGTKDRVQAFKVAAYAPTASWVAGIFALVPMLALLGIVGGLYSLFLFYKGIPKLMKTPEDKALPYTAVVIIIAIVAALVMGMVSSSVLAMSGAMNPMQNAAVSGSIEVPGAGKVDLGKLQEQAAKAEAVAKQLEQGGTIEATDPEALKAYLPSAVAGFTRTEVSASTGGMGGVEGSGAEGTYTRGEATIRLQVTDLGAAGAIAGMASAFNVKSSKETATGYEKVGKVGGRLTQESYDRQSRHGEYGVLVADRFMIQATGDGVSMDELKAAVNAVPVGRLEGLAKAS